MKSPLDGLDLVPWDALSHAYGDASDVPAHLQALYSGSVEAGEHAISELFAAILHQGTIYTATIPAIPFLARMAASAETRNRKEALWFLMGFGESIRNGWSKTPRYLPKGTDMKVFDEQCQVAMSEACETIAGVLSDPSAELRGLAAQVMQGATTISSQLVELLHQGLAREKDNDAKAAFARALLAAGALSESEVHKLKAEGSDKVLFSTAWKAVESGAEIQPWHFETLSMLWARCASQMETEGICSDAIVELVAAREKAILPLLNALAAQPSASAQRAAVEGAAALIGMLRSANEAVLEVLFDVAKQPAGESQDVRHLLVHTLGNLGCGGRVADVIVDLVLHDPAPTWAHNFKHYVDGKLVDEPCPRDIRADAAVALLRAGDPRWEQVLLKAQPETAMAGNGNGASSLPWALARNKAPCTPALLVMARERMLREPATWVALVSSWSQAEASSLESEIIAALPKAIHDAALLLGKCRCTAAIPALESLVLELNSKGSNAAMWPYIALAQLTGQAHFFEKARQAYGRPDTEGKAGHFLSDLLEAWAEFPDEGFYSLCRTLITGKPAVSFPGREEQLMAIKALAPKDGLDAIWPTLLAIVDKAEQPLADAAEAGLSLLEAGQLSEELRMRARDSLVAVLESIVRDGRSTWSGKDLRAPVMAMCALLQMNSTQPKAISILVAALKKATQDHHLLSVVPEICGHLEKLAQGKKADRKKIQATMTTLLESDTRVITNMDEERYFEDEKFRRNVSGTVDRMVANESTS